METNFLFSNNVFEILFFIIVVLLLGGALGMEAASRGIARHEAIAWIQRTARPQVLNFFFRTWGNAQLKFKIIDISVQIFVAAPR